MDVFFEGKKETTYAAVGVQSSKDYWNANVNDSDILTQSESVSGYLDMKRLKKIWLTNQAKQSQ